MNDRDCESCIHYKAEQKNGEIVHSCESWNCEYEKKPDFDCALRD